MFAVAYRNTERGIALRRPKPVLTLVVTVPEPEPVVPVRLPCPPSRVESDLVARTLHQEWISRQSFIRSATRIIKGVAAWHDYTIEDILGPSRKAALVTARFDAIVAVKQAFPDLSLPQLGKRFNRDHTTIRTALIVRGELTGNVFDRINPRERFPQ